MRYMCTLAVEEKNDLRILLVDLKGNVTYWVKKIEMSSQPS